MSNEVFSHWADWCKIYVLNYAYLCMGRLDIATPKKTRTTLGAMHSFLSVPSLLYTVDEKFNTMGKLL